MNLENRLCLRSFWFRHPSMPKLARCGEGWRNNNMLINQGRKHYRATESGFRWHSQSSNKKVLLSFKPCVSLICVCFSGACSAEARPNPHHSAAAAVAAEKSRVKKARRRKLHDSLAELQLHIAQPRPSMHESQPFPVLSDTQAKKKKITELFSPSPSRPVPLPAPPSAHPAGPLPRLPHHRSPRTSTKRPRINQSE